MRQKIMLFVLVLSVATLGATNAAFGLSFFTDFVNNNADKSIGGWFDAEKASDDFDDDLLCWAATASNILAWGGWGTTYGTDEDAIFEFLQDEDPIDAGGWMKYAWNFWFDGTELGGHFGGSSHTGFYSSLTFSDYYHEHMYAGASFMSTLDQYLRAGYGVGGAVRNGMYHAITFWGFDYHYDNGDIVYDGVWVTDSDDDKGGSHPRSDELKYYDICFDTPENKWYFDNFYGQTDVYLESLQALERNPIPEPSTFLILGLGLIGVIALKRKALKK